MGIGIGAYLVSKLGSPDSRIPLGVKDGFNSSGFTYFSYDAGGSVEGKDRFVDEFGTAAIWLGGIPFYKWLINKAMTCFSNISPEIDYRVIKNSDYLDKAIKNSPTEKIANELKTAKTFAQKTKGFTYARFFASMGLTLLSYLGLTKFKQNMTKNNIEKEFVEKMKIELQNNNHDTKNGIFDEFKFQKTAKTPSFGRINPIKTADEFLLNPVKNMILLDLGISGERLYHSRTDGELKEYAIKEGSFLFFVYVADRLIKKGIETASEKVLNLPVSLDAKFLSSKMSEEILNNEAMQNEVKEFNNKFGKGLNTKEFYDYIFKNQNSTVVEAAKISGIIETVDDKNPASAIDTRKYIEPDDIQKLGKDLDSYINSGKSSSEIKQYLNKVRGLKIASTFLSIGVCCFVLGYSLPKYIYEYRHNQQNGSKDYHVRKKYEDELRKKNF